MKIGIDITMLVYAGSGVANYTFNLVKNLLKIDKKNEYRLFYSSFRRPKNFYYLDELKKLGGKVYEYPLPPSLLKIIWGKLNIIPIEWFTGKVDLFFFSDFLRPPLLPGTKGITTIHDLTWKLFPQYHTQMVISAHEKKLEKTIRYDDTIIADSQNTKKDLLKLYPQIDKNKIHVIYPGIDERFQPIKDNGKIKKVLRKYNVFPPNFLLYVGAIEPRKNLETAIEVFHQFVSSLPKIEPTRLRSEALNQTVQGEAGKLSRLNEDWQFLIVGRAGWKNSQVFQLINRLKLNDYVKFIGFVNDYDLPYFYNGCRAFVYLSKYEGFGLPPVEAASCGKMVLMYENSSLKEIFNLGYPFTKEGEELKTLKEILEGKYDVKKYRKDFSWKKYCLMFLKILND